MSFTKVKSSPTFVTEFKNFIDYLIEKENLRYIGGGIESIDEIIMSNAKRYHNLSEELIEKIEKMTKSGMFGSKRTEKKEWVEYKIEFNHGSFMYTIVWYVERNTPNEIELIHFWFWRK